MPSKRRIAFSVNPSMPLKNYFCTLRRILCITLFLHWSPCAFIISRLHGGSVQWVHMLLKSRSPLLNDHNAFLQKLSSIYKNKKQRTQLKDKLVCIQQSGTVSTFANEFMAHCETLHIDLNTQIEDFHSRLKYTIREALAILPASITFDKLVVHTIYLDHAQYMFCKLSENQNHSNPSSYRKPSNLSPSQLKYLFLSTQFYTSQLCQTPCVHLSLAFSSPKSQRPHSLIFQELNLYKAARLCICCGESKY